MVARFQILARLLAWRGFHSYVQGPALICLILGLVALCDPESLAIEAWTVPLYLLSFFGAVFYGGYRLLFGDWTVLRWASMLPVLSVPALVYYGYLAAVLPVYALPVVVTAVLPAGLPIMGMVRRRAWVIWFLTFATAFVLFALWLRPDYYRRHWLQSVLVVAAVSIFYFWLWRTSDHLKELNGRIGRTLGEVRKSKRRIDSMARELTEKNDRMEADLQMARLVQESILPQSDELPAPPGLILRSRHVSLDSVGGDFYDAFALEEGRTALFIADVSGHGVAAALVTTMARVSFGRFQKLQSPGRVLDRVNRELYEYIGSLSHYITAFFAIVDLNEGRLYYSSAAHTAPLLHRRGEDRIMELECESAFFLGVEPRFDYSDQAIEIRPGDRLLLFTDGLVEILRENEYYGDRRFQTYVQAHGQDDAETLIEGLLEDARAFAGPKGFPDDIAVLCVDVETVRAGRDARNVT